MSSGFHERYDRPAPALPSDRSTGLVFSGIALVIAYLWRANITVLIAALTVAALLALCSVVASHLLHPLNKAWMRFAHLLSRVMNPVIMMVLFSLVIVPFGLVMQIVRDPLRKRSKADAATYWIERGKEEATGSMTNQF